MTRVGNSVLRLTLVSHAVTEAQRRARFESDEPVIAPVAVRYPGIADAVVIAPELRARQTAEGLGLTGSTTQAIADIDYGDWRGSTMDRLPEPDVLAWLTDTSFTPPGGESVDDLFSRVTGWMDRVASDPTRVCAVTHPAVIRAAVVRTLDAPRLSFWRVDIPPLTSTTVQCRAGRWTLRSVAEKIS